MKDRDLEGYAGAWPDITWPNGARLAVSVVINFEEGAELQVGDGDARSESDGRGDERRARPASATGARSRSSPMAREPGCGACWTRSSESASRSATMLLLRPGRRARARGSPAPVAARAAMSRPCMAGAGVRMPITTIARGRGRRPRCVPPPSIHASDGGWRRSASSAAAARARGRGRCSPNAAILYTSNGFDDDLPYWDRSTSPGRPAAGRALRARQQRHEVLPSQWLRAGQAEMVEYVTRCARRAGGGGGRAACPACSISASTCASSAAPRRFKAFQRHSSNLLDDAPRPALARQRAPRSPALSSPPFRGRHDPPHPDQPQHQCRHDRHAMRAIAAGRRTPAGTVAVEALTAPYRRASDHRGGGRWRSRGDRRRRRWPPRIAPRVRPAASSSRPFGDPGFGRAARCCCPCPVTGIAEAGHGWRRDRGRPVASRSSTTTPGARRLDHRPAAARYGLGAQMAGISLTAGGRPCRHGRSEPPGRSPPTPRNASTHVNRLGAEGRHHRRRTAGARGAYPGAARCPVPLVEPIPAAVRLALKRSAALA